jgi:hypothetical protein
MSSQKIDTEDRFGNGGEDERDDKGVETKIEFFGPFPQAEIGLPSAPDNSGPDVAAEDL